MRGVEVDPELIRHLRWQFSWSQAELASRCGLSRQTVENVELKGRCSLTTLGRLAAALRVQPTSLLARNADDPAREPAATENVPIFIELPAHFASVEHRERIVSEILQLVTAGLDVTLRVRKG